MKRAQRGHAILEMALGLSVFAAFLTGILQFGYSFYVYSQLVTAVGNGARYASVRPLSGDIEADKAAVRNVVIYGKDTPPPDSPRVAPGLQPEQVDVEYADNNSSIRVAIRGYKLDAFAASFDFDGRPAAQFPYIGPRYPE